MTQAELASKLSTSQGLLSRYERGGLRVHAALVADIARALETSTDEILGLKEVQANGLYRNRRFIHRLQQIDTLPKRKKQALLMTIDSFLQASQAKKPRERAGSHTARA